MVAIDAQITHSTRKLNNAQKTMEDVVRGVAVSQGKYDALQKELASVKRAADAAQGNEVPFLLYLLFHFRLSVTFCLQRLRERHLSIIWP